MASTDLTTIIGITRPATACVTTSSSLVSSRARTTVLRRGDWIQLLVGVDNHRYAAGRSRATRAGGADAVRAKSADGAHALWRGRRGDALPGGRRPDVEDLPGHGETVWSRT